MLFNSVEFAIFLPIVFALYWWVLRSDLKAQNLFVLLASYIFYGWWDWRFLSLIILSSGVDYWVGRQMGKTEVQGRRRCLLYVSLAVNLGLLGFFKYYNFFVEEFIAAFDPLLPGTLHAGTLNIILPVGISFYTFQTLSYTIDLYRRQIEPVKDWIAFFAYVSFFPQLVAGPIERSTQLVPQFLRPRTFNYEEAKDGVRQILWGLFKKMVIADSCALVVNDIFADYASLDTGTLVLGAVLFAFQIYGDFSGYSDIAIGTARLFGFRLMRNFAYPYFARNIAEFWRRWHISLSTWFRDYVYVPLGGSRVNRRKLIRNVFVVFIVSGFWHGANWTFIIWGALHALFFLPLILLNRNRRYLDVPAAQRAWPHPGELIQMLATFSLVCLGWIFFRAENLPHALGYLNAMLTKLTLDISPWKENAVLLFGIGLLIWIEWLQRDQQHAFAFDDHRPGRLARAGLYIITAFSILLFSPQQESPFIYFQF